MRRKYGSPPEAPKDPREGAADRKRHYNSLYTRDLISIKEMNDLYDGLEARCEAINKREKRGRIRRWWARTRE